MPVPQAAKTVAFSTSREDKVLSYRFACMFVSFRSKLKKLWHNRRSFPRGACSRSTRSNGTVPFNQTLIQRRRRSFTVPSRLLRPHP